MATRTANDDEKSLLVDVSVNPVLVRGNWLVPSRSELNRLLTIPIDDIRSPAMCVPISGWLSDATHVF